MLVGVMRHASASEAYVQRYLERELGMDSFSLQVWGAAGRVEQRWCRGSQPQG